jgi:hypothetical protein
MPNQIWVTKVARTRKLKPVKLPDVVNRLIKQVNLESEPRELTQTAQGL